MNKDNSALLGGCLTVIILLIFAPVITFFCGWFGGWMLMNIIGDAVASGFNTLFGTTRFTPDMLPIVCGSLALIGSCFKSTNTTSK